ncbi:MAG: hypothetical protein HY002_07790, partial [Candidatus Rokubacteria bacterium]|nr:hypothetical protein [Candidatus Rokubacteria bacterium]
MIQDSEPHGFEDAPRGRLSRRALLKGAAALGLSQAAVAGLAPARARAQGAQAAKPGGTSIWAAETDPVHLNPITNSNFSSTQGFEH